MAGNDKPEDHDGGVSAATKASAAVGLLAACALAVVVNVLVARNNRRWDWTSARLYTLSQPTKETLRGLTETVQVNVLLSASDPLTVSVRHTLEAYRSETTHLDVRYLDPDRKPAEFRAFQQQYGIAAGLTQDGRVVADAILVVVKGDRKWFLTQGDLVDLTEADEGRSRPKLEQGLTIAIRNVLGGERSKVCFTKGHGELGADEPGPRGLSELKHRLSRNNVDIAVVDSSLIDFKNEKAEPWKGCTLVIVAGPQVPFPAPEARALGGYFQGGGALFLLLTPLLDGDRKRTVPSGLEPVLALGGVEVRGDTVFERDKAFMVPGTMGEIFLAQPKAHGITEGLLKVQEPRVVVLLSQSLSKLGSSAVQPSELLVSSKDAFGMVDPLARGDGPPEKAPGDRDGPLTVAMASELPKKDGEPHGPRMVVAGTTSLVQGQVWQEMALRHSAIFVESAISWLTSRPQIIDVPAKASRGQAGHLTEDSLDQVRNYVTLYIPLAVSLVGAAVYLRRRSTERRGEAPRRVRGKED